MLSTIANRLAGIVSLKRKGSVLVGCCPFHNEKTASFYVYPDEHFHCFGCSRHGWINELTKDRPQKREYKPEPEKIWPSLDVLPFKENAIASRISQRLSKWRGYSISLCDRLVDRGHVLACDGQIAFPIRQHGRITRLHVRKDESVDWKAKESSPFYYYPTVGSKVDCFSIDCGVSETHFFESQWDAMALIDATRRKSLYVATRGAANASKISALKLPSAPVYLWPQSDDAGDVWMRGVKNYLTSKTDIRIIHMPDGIKDANDLHRLGNLREWFLSHSK